MDIVIIGAGNVAHCFGHLMKLHGHHVTQVISKRKENARELAELLGGESATDLLDINMEADVYLLAVNDSVIPELNDLLRLGRRIVVHTAGAVPMEAIARISTNVGVMYPLQSIRKEIKSYPAIPLILEARNEEVLKRLHALAQSISPITATMDSAQRLQMHLAAVFCNNFTNHLIALAKFYCEQEGRDFSLLAPIIRETFQRLDKYPPESVQTGPALRHDQQTMTLHESILAQYPAMQQIYPMLSESIYQFHHAEK
jgi:Pyrroline-5-carboxylate reductase